MKGIKLFLYRAWNEISYAQKAFFSILSGFDQLQYKNGEGEWENVGDDYPDNPHYVCPVFYNQRHIPLPFFTNQEVEIGWLQLQAIKFATKLNPGSYQAAQEACAWYEHEWDNFVKWDEVERQALREEEDLEAINYPDDEVGTAKPEPREVSTQDSPGGFSICQ